MDEVENIAETLARKLPKAEILSTINLADLVKQDSILHFAVPSGFKVEEIDLERLLPNPRRTNARAAFTDVTSFLAYIKRHAGDNSAVWCTFNPQSFLLSFTAVIDEHAKGVAGWRHHVAVYVPELSAEWKIWSGNNGKSKSQLEFAEFIERNDTDISAQDGYPSSLDMMKLATEFEASSEKRVKSVVRLQGGGTRLDFVDDDDTNTITQMKLFERFQIGIPVFWAGPAYRIDSRLKYRHNSGKVNFWYELIRPDRVHDAAARELIDVVRTGIGELPLLMGACS